MRASVRVCVEVVVREVVDTLLFDPDTLSFASERLPPNAHPAMRRFYEEASSSGADSGFRGAGNGE